MPEHLRLPALTVEVVVVSAIANVVVGRFRLYDPWTSMMICVLIVGTRNMTVMHVQNVAGRKLTVKETGRMDCRGSKAVMVHEIQAAMGEEQDGLVLRKPLR